MVTKIRVEKEAIDKRWWLWVFLIFMVIAVSVVNVNKDNFSTHSDEKNSINVSHQPDKNEAENACQDVRLVGQYVNIDEIDIITFDYNPHFFESGEKDKAGNSIWRLEWSGQIKKSSIPLAFSCEVANMSNKIEVLSLSINGNAIYNSKDLE